MSDVDNTPPAVSPSAVSPSAVSPSESAAADEGLMLDGGEQAADADKIEGIIAQVGYDYRGDDLDELAARLRQRFEQSNVPFTETELARYAERIAGDNA